MVPVARSLNRIGVPVDLADFASVPPSPSRVIREFRRVPRPDLDRPGFVKHLRQFILDGGHDTLIPTDDQALTALAQHYADFKDLLHIACPPPEITNLVLNKTLTLEIAKANGIRVPESTVVTNSAQLTHMALGARFPWVFKPAEKETRVEETKSMRLTSAEDVRREFPNPREFFPAMLVQEFCPGHGVGIEMLMHEGMCLAAFQHRRLKEFPFTGGVSVTAVAETLDPALLNSSLTLLRALQWEGLAMVEYKINSDNGEAVLMEVNGRAWGTISLPMAAGLDFPLYQWKILHGEEPNIPTSYTVGKKWRWTSGVLLRLAGLTAKYRISNEARQELRRSCSDIWNDFGPQVADATFAFSDPMPSISAFLRVFRALVSHCFTSLRNHREQVGYTESRN